MIKANTQCELSCFSLFQFSAKPQTVAHQAPLSMGFPGQEHCSGLPCPLSQDLPNPGIKPVSPVSPALQADFFFFFLTTEPLGKPKHTVKVGNHLNANMISKQQL